MTKKTAGLTPMMQQYLDMKEENPDCLLFFRLGDFYEMFFEDAITASKELDIVLTGRDCGLSERAPMCGVPHHSVDNYINRLIDKGYRIAICEQLTDPKESKGIVERGIVRIISPGTVVEENMLEEQRNNYILCLYLQGEELGISYADVSTGEFHLGELKAGIEQIQDILAQIQPAEIVCDEKTAASSLLHNAALSLQGIITKYSDWAFDNSMAEKNLLGHFQVASLDGFGCSDCPVGVSAGGALLAYLNETQKNALLHINKIQRYRVNEHMILDAHTRRNLELTQQLNGEKGKKGTLLGLLNRSQTAMGGRMLRKWVEEPLCQLSAIQKRHGAVEELFQEAILCQNLRESFDQVYDLERICGKIAYGTVNARDALALKNSLAKMPELKEQLKASKASRLREIDVQFDPMQDLYELLDRAIALEPPIGIKDGDIIREGYNEQIDTLRSASGKAKEWLADLEAREKEATGIKNLKIGFNKVFGYYIEVTKSYLSQVPFRFQRKQTLANAERYITEELKQLEDQVLGSQEKATLLEYTVFCGIRKLLEEQIPRIQTLAKLIAELDCLQSLASVAREYDYVKPQMHEGDSLEISEGRHPVVERMTRERFVANDAYLDNESQRLAIITGPNMAGKSTYMRQVALICLLAHVGSFVPAKTAKIPLLDRIFTRVGASDDLTSGQSTFMMEMSETANILHNATKRSLLIMDEIGRGTSTFDGLSIAWAVCEYIADPKLCGAKTLFATHYHELSTLEGKLDGVVNYRITVKELGDDVVFLRKVARGGTDKSFGIHVARLAGVPDSVIERAKDILIHLEASDLNHSALLETENVKPQKKNSYSPRMKRLMSELREIDINSLTPIEALLEMNKIKELSDAIDQEEQ